MEGAMGDSKVVEEKEYTWTVEGNDGIIELLLDAKGNCQTSTGMFEKSFKVTRKSKRLLFQTVLVTNNNKILTLTKA